MKRIRLILIATGIVAVSFAGCEKGETGPQGVQGEKGDKGDKGDKRRQRGDRGNKDPAANKGPAELREAALQLRN